MRANACYGLGRSGGIGVLIEIEVLIDASNCPLPFRGRCWEIPREGGGGWPEGSLEGPGPKDQG